MKCSFFKLTAGVPKLFQKRTTVTLRGPHKANNQSWPKNYKRFLVRFDAKTGGYLNEDQKNNTKKRSSPYFNAFFAGILGGDHTKQRKIDLVSCKIFLLLHLEQLKSRKIILPQNRVWAALTSS